MGNSKDGCVEYTKAIVDINFPKDRVCCKLCVLLQTYSRNQCMRTGELIADTNGVGIWCPLHIVDEDGVIE
jgi:hypothetical protein